MPMISLPQRLEQPGCRATLLDRAETQWSPAGVGGEPAQQWIQRPASDHVDFHRLGCQLLAEIDCASVCERELCRMQRVTSAGVSGGVISVDAHCIRTVPKTSSLETSSES